MSLHRPLLLLLAGGLAFSNWQPKRSAVTRRAEASKKEVVYNYFAQDYAVITREQKPFDAGRWLSELLPWSAGELRAREVLDEVLPKWRSIEVGPKNFRALAEAAGGDEPALAAMRKNVAVLYFGEGQIQRAGETLTRCLGKERAMQIIQKNPGALTIDPENLESNMGSVCLAADALDVVISNAEISRTVGGALGGFFAISIGKAVFDVVALRVMQG
eukprot:CAMPEP_0181535460 /NCGR_PEP_ID=MMETSP1110-20121109/74265_1 /TAXON_ID=174948 /ORGANISM="Symbiodinium sp., Strain CCMP421" /LENGTH=216 /DNA_ID=CAMNT_0023666837 /DNA_START=33 /DNA_END=684 /DNA_ORIENTATION=+